jgi:kinetochore protein Spc7/SPC105
VTATAVDLPQLKLYTRVSQDLQNWVEQSKVVYQQAEEEAAKLTPELFREYSQADEEGQGQLLVCSP